MLDSYPKLDVEPDNELPDKVKTPFREAVQCLNAGIWNGCVMTARRALQEAMKDLGATKGTLNAQIDELANDHRIMPQIQEWAHETRLAGNLGAHGNTLQEFANEQDAEDIVEFSKWIYRYVYALPKQLDTRRARLSKGSG